MNALLLILSVITGVSQQVFRKEYNKRYTGGVYSFSVVSAIFVLLFFLLTAKYPLAMTGQTMGYATIFALSYAITTITTMLAIQCGPLALTSLMVSYSTAVPTLYGFLFLKEPLTLRLGLGLLLLCISLFFINREGKKEEKTLTLRWGILAFVTFFGNGLCGTVQKAYQVTTGGAAEGEFMIFAISIVVAILLVATLVTEKKETLSNLKQGVLWSGLCGIGNACTNYLGMLLALTMPASVLYPLSSAGSIVLTAVVSILFYREKLSGMQKIGFLLGIAAIVALS